MLRVGWSRRCCRGSSPPVRTAPCGTERTKAASLLRRVCTSIGSPRAAELRRGRWCCCDKPGCLSRAVSARVLSAIRPRPCSLTLRAGAGAVAATRAISSWGSAGCGSVDDPLFRRWVGDRPAIRTRRWAGNGRRTRADGSRRLYRSTVNGSWTGHGRGSSLIFSRRISIPFMSCASYPLDISTGSRSTSMSGMTPSFSTTHLPLGS